MFMPSRVRPDRRLRPAAAALLVAAAVQWFGPGARATAAATASHVDIVAVIPPAADRRAVVVADVRPPPAAPLGPGAFSVNAGEARLPTQAAAVVSDRLAIGVVVDSSAAGGAAVQAGLNGAANFLLQMPSLSRAAVVTDSRPPAVVSPLSAGPAAALHGLASVQAGGQRSTAAALTLALRQLPASSDAPRLLLLYTGAPDAGSEPATDLAARLTAAHVLLAVVDTGTDRRYWSRVTAATGGVLAPAAPSAAVGAFGDVAAALRARYVLSFPAPGPLPARVSVRVRTAEATLIADALVPAGTAAGAAHTGGGHTAARHTGEGQAGGGAIRILAVAVGALTVLVLLAALIVRLVPPRHRRTPDRVRPRPTGDAAHSPDQPSDRAPLGDERSYRQLDTRIGNLAAAVAEGRLDRRHAVALIALAAPGRPDLLDRATDSERRITGSPLGRWPPSETVLNLLEAARRVTLGDTALVGPDGIRVEQAQVSDPDGDTRTLLRLTRNGQPVGECRTVKELAQQVDVSTLAEDANGEASNEQTEPS